MTGLTWRELANYILNDMPDRFLDTPVQVFDCLNNVTYSEGVEIFHDMTEDDFTIDMDQPQLFIGYEPED